MEAINQINYKFMNPDYSGKFLFDWRKFQSMRLLVKDHLYFIDYLNPLVNHYNERVTTQATADRQAILENIKKSTASTDPFICQKFSWVNDYIRSFVEQEIWWFKNLRRQTKATPVSL